MVPRALFVGEASVDLVGAVPRYPVRLGDRQELSAFALQGGGPAANSAVAFAKLGGRAVFGGVLPDDFLGDFAAQSLVDAGVDPAYLKRQQGGVSPVSFIALDEERRRRTVFFTRGDWQVPKAEDFPADAVEGIDLLLVDGAFPEAQLSLVKAARQKGVRTLLTAHAMAEGMAQLAAACESVIASEGFARELSPLVPKSLEELFSLGVKCAVVTLGDDGAVGQEQGRDPVRVEPHPVKVVDPTGAGDVFRGAFAYGWIGGMPLRDRLRFAVTAASLKCRSYGARDGMPDLAEVNQASSS
ncbi:MAG: hypothetical protein HYZ28_16500 [Myxococcales bacterium]|nr:hypothetical protein [Myxococcales bacterium]